MIHSISSTVLAVLGITSCLGNVLNQGIGTSSGDVGSFQSKVDHDLGRCLCLHCCCCDPCGTVSQRVVGWMRSNVRPAKELPKTPDQSHFGQSLPPGDLTRFLEHAATGIIPGPKRNMALGAHCSVDGVLACRGWASLAHPGVTYFFCRAQLKVFQGDLCTALS